MRATIENMRAMPSHALKQIISHLLGGWEPQKPHKIVEQAAETRIGVGCAAEVPRNLVVRVTSLQPTRNVRFLASGGLENCVEQPSANAIANQPPAHEIECVRNKDTLDSIVASKPYPTLDCRLDSCACV